MHNLVAPRSILSKKLVQIQGSVQKPVIKPDSLFQQTWKARWCRMLADLASISYCLQWFCAALITSHATNMSSEKVNVTYGCH